MSVPLAPEMGNIFIQLELAFRLPPPPTAMYLFFLNFILFLNFT